MGIQFSRILKWEKFPLNLNRVVTIHGGETSLFQRKKLVGSWELQHKLLLIGITAVKSNALELHPEYESTINKAYSDLVINLCKTIREKQYVMLECRPKNKWTTLTDKSVCSDHNTLIQTFIQTSLRGLIGNEKALKPFWNAQSKEKSDMLWLPTETDSADLLSNSWNPFSQCLRSNSLFSVKTNSNPEKQNLQTISCPSSTSTLVGTWGSGDTNVTRARKIRIYPTKKQQKTLRQWTGVARSLYNKALYGIKTRKEPICESSLVAKYITNRFTDDIDLYRSRVFDERINVFTPIPDYELEVPKDVRRTGISDLINAYSAMFSNLKNGNIKRAQMQFRKKKVTFPINIPKTAISKHGNMIEFYPRFNLGKLRVCRDRSFRDLQSIDRDSKLFESRGKWYISIPVCIPKKKVDDNNLDDCALDPGARNFVTLYSDTVTATIGVNKEVVKRYRAKIDHLRSRRDKGDIDQAYFDKWNNKFFDKLNNKVKEMHNQLSVVLVKSFGKVFLPKFESQELIRNDKSILRASTKRDILSLGHFKFREHMKNKFSEYSKLDKLVICTEEYTTKTCTKCGQINDNVGGADTFICVSPSCGLRINRDINGARNILIKCSTNNKKVKKLKS